MLVKNLCCFFFNCLVKFATETILDLEVSLQKRLMNNLNVLNRHSTVELIRFIFCDCCYCEYPFKGAVFIGVKIYILFPYFKNICKICSSNASFVFFLIEQFISSLLLSSSLVSGSSVCQCSQGASFRLQPSSLSYLNSVLLPFHLIFSFPEN